MENTIECTMIVNGKQITLDLTEYLGDFGAMIDAIYEEIGLETPIDFDSKNGDVQIVDTDYFNSFDELETFIEIDFDDDEHAPIFLAWQAHTGYSLEDYETFQEAYRGTYPNTEEFSEEFSEECGELENVPDYIKGCIDWVRVWESALRHDFIDMKVENGEAFGTTLYSVAIFSRV